MMINIECVYMEKLLSMLNIEMEGKVTSQDKGNSCSPNKEKNTSLATRCATHAINIV